MAEDQNLACAPNRGLALTIWRAEDVTLRGHHHVIEILREHCRCEESDRTQRLLTNIDEVVLYWRRDCKNAAWTYPVSGAVFHVQFAGAGDDVLRLFGGIGVPAKPRDTCLIKSTVVSSGTNLPLYDRQNLSRLPPAMFSIVK